MTPLNYIFTFSFDTGLDGWQFFTNAEMGGSVNESWDNGQLKINFDKNFCDHSSGEWRYYPTGWIVSFGDIFQVHNYTPDLLSVGTHLTVYFQEGGSEGVYYGHGDTGETNQLVTLSISVEDSGKTVHYIRVEGHSGSSTCDEERNIFFDNITINLANSPITARMYLPIIVK